MTQNWDRSISNFAWSPDGKHLFATTDHLGQHPLWSIDAVSGRATALTGDGDVEAFDSGPRDIVYAHSNLSSPANLYTVGFAGGKALELTHVNQEVLAHRKLSAYEQFSFPGWHDETVFGYVVKPVDFKNDGKYPIAFVVHGGPEGSMANVWHWRWNAQTLAGAGLRGGVDRLPRLHRLRAGLHGFISGDWGGKPLEDLKLGLAAALQRYPWLDGDRACALGGSYGGYMMNWIAGQWPDRFKCLVTHDRCFRQPQHVLLDRRALVSRMGEWRPRVCEPGRLRQVQSRRLRQPLEDAHVGHHGQLDYRVPYTQGLGVFTACNDAASPANSCIFRTRIIG